MAACVKTAVRVLNVEPFGGGDCKPVRKTTANFPNFGKGTGDVLRDFAGRGELATTL